jgi:chromosome partitioning protein
MISVAFVTSKGGAGKSTSATCFAVAACEAGQRVLLLDTDHQRSSASWAARRPQANPVVVATTPTDTFEILGAADRLGYDCTVIDTAAADIRGLVAISRVVDLNIVVVRPTLADIEVATTVRAAITRPHAALLTQTPPVLCARLHAWMTVAVTTGEVVDAMLAYRVTYQDAFAAGRGVTEWAPSSPAAREVHAAYDWIAAKLHEVNNARC